MSGHTRGKLALIEGGSECNHLVRDDGEPVATLLNTEVADARRLAACWNAADGLPTAELEAAADGRLLNVFEALVRDRDALLAGVREANLALRDLIARNPTMAGTQRGSTTLGNLAAELGALIQKVGTP